MTAFLLDVNVLVAFAWPTHSANQTVTRWMARHAEEGWATCPFTQAALVRILSNPAFSPDALTPGDAIALLAANLKHPAHRFWADDVSFNDAISPFRDRIVAHQQVTDAYLLGLAIRKKGRFATLDRGVRNLLADNRVHSSVEVIAPAS